MTCVYMDANGEYQEIGAPHFTTSEICIKCSMNDENPHIIGRWIFSKVNGRWKFT